MVWRTADGESRGKGGQFILELRLLARVHGPVTRPSRAIKQDPTRIPKTKFIYLNSFCFKNLLVGCVGVEAATIGALPSGMDGVIILRPWGGRAAAAAREGYAYQQGCSTRQGQSADCDDVLS